LLASTNATDSHQPSDSLDLGPVTFSYSPRWNWGSRCDFWRVLKWSRSNAGRDLETAAVLPIVEIQLATLCHCRKRLLRRRWMRIEISVGG
jgi:hypothetical protein